MKKPNLYSFVFLILWSFSLSSWAYTPDKIYRFTIVHVSDTHGEFMPNHHGEYGFARLKYQVDKIRAECQKNNRQLFVFSSGDMNTGNPRSDLQKGRPDVEAFNSIGFDAMTLGNHEFDLSHDDLFSLAELANFPFISANIYDQEKRKRKFTPYLEKKVDDLGVAILGLTTEDTNGQPRIDGFWFRSVIDEAKELLPELKKRNDLIIGLTHIGYYGDGNEFERTPGDLTLVRSLPNQFDLILGGHTHSHFYKPVYEQKTLISHSGERGEFFTKIDFEFQNGKIKLTNYQSISLKKGEKDKKLQDVLALYHKKGGLKIGEEVGEIDQDFWGRNAKLHRETNLGRLITRAQNDFLKSDIGIMSDRGIRYNLFKGKITYENILRVLPFYNTVCTFDLTATQLKTYLESLPDVLHLDGIKIYKKGKIIRKMEIKGNVFNFDKQNQEKIDDSIFYKVSLNAHNAHGGSLWPDQSKNHTFVDTGFDHAFVLKSYVQKVKKVRGDDFKFENVIQD